MPRYLTDLADILRDAGLTVVEIPGWKTRAATMGGKPGPFDPVGILCHHTAGKGDGYGYAEWMATVGYPPTLYPPLAQCGLDRQGVWYVQAAGRANHAGRCRPIAGLKTLPGQSYGDGNTQLLGIEAMNTGSEGWSATQYGSYVRGVAALKKAYGWDIVLGHKETSIEGKVDPDFSMNQFRDDVAANPQEDDIMAVISADEVVQKIRNSVLFDAVINVIDRNRPEGEEPRKMSLATGVRVAHADGKEALAAIEELRAGQEALAGLVAAQSGGTVSKDEVLAEIRAAGQEAAKAKMATARLGFDEAEVNAPAPEVQP